MEYLENHSAVTLDHNIYHDYEYLIVNLGKYPAAYVRIPDDHSYYYGDFWNMKIKPHSDLSFGGTLEKYHLEGFWIGWEYNLFGDYVVGRTREYISDGWHKKYTTRDILDTVYQVIEKLEELS